MLNLYPSEPDRKPESLARLLPTLVACLAVLCPFTLYAEYSGERGLGFMAGGVTSALVAVPAWFVRGRAVVLEDHATQRRALWIEAAALLQAAAFVVGSAGSVALR